MTDSFKRWWQGRTLREQRLLLAMGGLAALVLAWLLVIRPLDDALSAARERHGAAAVALAEARANAAAIQGLQSEAPANLGGPVDTMLNQSATEAGFPVARVERVSESEASITIDSARPQALFGWIRQMESRGLVVARLTVTANADPTVSAQATFRRRGG